MAIGQRLLGFADELRAEGVAVGTSEILDSLRALDEVPWQDPADFREALAATIAKSPEDRHIFELVFDRYFFRTAEESALQRQEEGEEQGESQDLSNPELEVETMAGSGSDLEALMNAVRQAVASGDEDAMRDLARMAVAMFGRQGAGSGVVGVDVQRIRRGLGLSTVPPPDAGEASGAGPSTVVTREQLNAFERHVRREVERSAIRRQGELPPARPLNELDRSLPTNPTQDLSSIHRAVGQMKRRLATRGSEARGRTSSRVVDLRRTMRASMETGGVPLELRFRPRRPRRPEIYLLCDVSTSVTSASVFFLSVLHAMHDSFRKLRSFVFIERISEVTEVFESERDFQAVAERISNEGGVADASGYTDYGRVWLEFLEEVAPDLGPSSTVIVLGDARTNGRPPHAETFGRIASRAGRLFWLNPEPRLYWNYGDSVMAAYQPYCDGAFECWTTSQLVDFVDVVAGSPAAAPPAAR